MGFLDLYRIRKPKDTGEELEDTSEEELEPLPKLSLAEMWPPSPRVKMLYIALAFVLGNLLLMCVVGILVYVGLSR